MHGTDHQDDAWSVGVILLTILRRRFPNSADDVEAGRRDRDDLRNQEGCGQRVIIEANV